VEFVRFPIFLGNKWASGMEIGSFEVVSKTFFSAALFPKWRDGMQGNGLNGMDMPKANLKTPVLPLFWFKPYRRFHWMGQKT